MPLSPAHQGTLAGIRNQLDTPPESLSGEESTSWRVGYIFGRAVREAEEDKGKRVGEEWGNEMVEKLIERMEEIENG